MCGKVDGSSGSSNAGSTSSGSNVGLTADEKAQLDQLNPSIKNLYLLAKQAAAGDPDALQQLMQKLPPSEQQNLSAVEQQGQQQAYLEQLMQRLLQGQVPGSSDASNSSQSVSGTSGTQSASYNPNADSYRDAGLYSNDVTKYLQGITSLQNSTSSSSAPTMSAASYAVQNGNVAA